jgi:hypothetical protein
MQIEIDVNNFHLQILIVFVITLNLLIYGTEISYAQNSTQNDSQVQISKTASSNIVISNGSSSVEKFNSTYMITGTADDIKNSKDLILGTVTDDFTNSSTAGYVSLDNSSEVGDKQHIANPFASNEKIKQKIEELMDKSIAGVANSESDMVSITCHFGNSLNLFSCQ